MTFMYIGLCISVEGKLSRPFHDPTYYKLEIDLTRKRKKAPGNNGHWSDKQRIETVTLWLATGNLALTAATLGIPEITCRKWKASPWWKQMVEDFRQEENISLDATLSKVVKKSVEQLLDRVEGGDYQYDQKTGQLVRKPISARDAATITKDMLDRRDILQGKKEVISNDARRMEDRLLKLADEFSRFAKSKVVVEVPMETLPNG